MSAGVHISKTFYLGVYTLTGRVITTDTEDDNNKEDEKYDQPGFDNQKNEIGMRQVYEIRISPWELGFYFSFGYLHANEDKFTSTFLQTQRIIGGNTYDTALEIEVVHPEYSGPALGFGINHVFAGGISLGTGMTFGTRQRKRPEVTVTSTTEGITISQSDLDKLIEDVEDEEMQYPAVSAHLSIGYNF